jgi:hypothetical protein
MRQPGLGRCLRVGKRRHDHRKPMGCPIGRG